MPKFVITLFMECKKYACYALPDSTCQQQMALVRLCYIALQTLTNKHG